MKKMLLIIVMLTGSIVAQIDNQVPPEVHQVIDSVLSGHNNRLSVSALRIVFGLDKTKTLADVKAGTPVQEYLFLVDTIRRKGPSAPLSELITPFIGGSKGEWLVPLFVGNRIVGFGRIRNNNLTQGHWKWTEEMGGEDFELEWQKVIDKWPTSRGYHPILIDFDTPDGNVFFHVPEEDPYNLTYLCFHHYAVTDSLAAITDSTYSTLTDSKKILKYLLRRPVVQKIGR